MFNINKLLQLIEIIYLSYFNYLILLDLWATKINFFFKLCTKMYESYSKIWYYVSNVAVDHYV